MKPAVFFPNFFGHLNTINHHKFQVMKNCFRVGLYKQGLLHDMSKYSFTEFIPGVKYYQVETEVRIMRKERQRAVRQRGFTIRDATSIIMSTGLIIQPRVAMEVL